MSSDSLKRSLDDGDEASDSPHTEPRSVRQRVSEQPEEGPVEWKQCAALLREALEAMPFGDAPPADMSSGSVHTAMSVAQLLTCGDKLHRPDANGPRPSEEVIKRWMSHTLTGLATANRSHTATALRSVADAIEASPPDASLLPSHLLVRYGPSALT